MQTISTTATNTLMAQWLATGGAIEAPATPETGGDDGLSTAPHTFIVYCVEDSGLSAQGPSVQFPCLEESEGLKALSVSRACLEESDGLKAGNFTNPWTCR